jgi:DNA invertase Pin-like site-specific DNA recombinase
MKRPPRKPIVAGVGVGLGWKNGQRVKIIEDVLRTIDGKPAGCAAYIRVSSRSQDFPTQKAAIERAAEARGDYVEHWYSEKASGRSLERPELANVRKAAQAGIVRRLYIFRIDRLTRSGIRDTLAVVEELRQCGCQLVTVADGFQIDGPWSDIVLAVMAWAAQMERLAIGERIAAARKRVEAQGGRWGRPRRVDRKTRERIAALRAEGRSVRFIAQALKIPRSTIVDHMEHKPT